MAIPSERGKLLFRKMERDLRRISSDLNPDTIHAFRTTSRRLQVLLEELLTVRTRNQKKLIQVLDRIRKRAGKVRDIDVQLAALRSLKTSQEPRRKTQLIHNLIELRARQEKKLIKVLKKDAIRDARKRLRKASKEAVFDHARDPLSVARTIADALPISLSLPDEEALHQRRLAVKRARYAAELAAPSNESAQFVGQLKELQDALGHWHDWTTLTRTAVDHFGEINQSSLVAALQNVTRGKFRQAIASLPRPTPAQSGKRLIAPSKVTAMQSVA